MSHYIGKIISVVATSDVRYVGRLEAISAETSTVRLAEVRNCGTEGRRGGSDEVPPVAQIFSHIEFKGSDVKDLQVLDEEAPAPSHATGRDGSPLSSQAQTQTDSASSDGSSSDSASNLGDYAAIAARSAELAAERDQATIQNGTAFYNKGSSFFDNLSGSGADGAGSRAQERRLNTETFGEAGASYRGQRGRGRGRGRGGRGFRGGRGGRGGFQSRGDSNRPPPSQSQGQDHPQGRPSRRNQSRGQDEGNKQDKGTSG